MSSNAPRAPRMPAPPRRATSGPSAPLTHTGSLGVGATIVAAIIGVLVCLLAAGLTQFSLFGEMPSPAENHRAALWLCGIPMVVGAAATVISRCFHSSTWRFGAIVFAFGFGSYALTSVQYDRRADRLEQTHVASAVWLAELPLPTGVTRTGIDETPASLDDARSTTGHVGALLQSELSVQEQFDALDPVLRSAGAELVRGECSESDARFGYSLADGRTVQVRLVAPSTDSDSTTYLSVTYPRDGPNTAGAQLWGASPFCLEP